MDFFTILYTRITWIDIAILIIFIGNFIAAYLPACRSADRLYRHFSRTDGLSSLPEDAAENIRAVTTKERLMTPTELLECRNRMNKHYSAFAIITTMFPLLGMLGTVISLIPMVNTIGAQETQLFFGALTSTFWGIVCALACKGLDIRIAYKIDDNEKHVEFLLNPKRTADEKGT